MPRSKTCGVGITANRPDFTQNTANGDSSLNHCQATSPLKIVNATVPTSLACNPNSSLTQSFLPCAFADFIAIKKWSFYGHAH